VNSAEGKPAGQTSVSPSPLILTMNGGSSSVKFAVFTALGSLERVLSGKIDRIGLPQSRYSATHADTGQNDVEEVSVPDHHSAVKLLIDRLDRSVGMTRVQAIGHRLVHGGEHFYRPEIVTTELIEALKKIVAFAPNHLPSEIELIEAFRRIDPSRHQVACFDTAFHHDLPRVSRILPIPRRYEKLGVRRYGFHGLSYSFLMEKLEEIGGIEEAKGRVILAHLGAGSSLAAVRDGRAIDTTMAFTPAAGVVMGTRSGDIDPGLVDFLAQTEGMSPSQFFRMTSHESGLLGVSETTSDFRDLLAREESDVRAGEAVDLFCYRVRLAIGAFAAALEGLDTLIFSGGIGENSAEARHRICEGLRHLGVQVDRDRNQSHAKLISPDGLPVRVRVIPTDEEAMIAKAVSHFMNIGDSVISH